jgi:hypothetical protein
MKIMERAEPERRRNERSRLVQYRFLCVAIDAADWLVRSIGMAILSRMALQHQSYVPDASCR